MMTAEAHNHLYTFSSPPSSLKTPCKESKKFPFDAAPGNRNPASRQKIIS
jgi:hypothetical protein